MKHEHELSTTVIATDSTVSTKSTSNSNSNIISNNNSKNNSNSNSNSAGTSPTRRSLLLKSLTSSISKVLPYKTYQHASANVSYASSAHNSSSTSIPLPPSLSTSPKSPITPLSRFKRNGTGNGTGTGTGTSKTKSRQHTNSNANAKSNRRQNKRNTGTDGNTNNVHAKNKNKFKSPWSNRKSKQKHNSFNNNNYNSIGNSYSNSNPCSPQTPRSEKTILGSDTLDGIEVLLKQNGMEVMHVLGHKGRSRRGLQSGKLQKEDDDDVVVHSPLKMMEGILGHTTPVCEKDYSIVGYHAVCDFELKKKKHRVPIRGHGHRGEGINNAITLEEQLELLEKYPVVSEEEALSEELRHLWYEMKAIESKRREIANAGKKGKDSTSAVASISHDCDKWTRCPAQKCGRHWDINIYLNTVDKGNLGMRNYSSGVSKGLKKYLQERRGAYLHAGFPVSKGKDRHGKTRNTQKSFAMRNGGNPNSCAVHKSLRESASFLELFGMHCVATTSTTTRHLAIMMDGDLSPTFFASKDDGRSHCDGTLPFRLLERMREGQEQNNSNPSIFGDIRYLSIGPNDSYYAELVSGQCYWGIGRYDESFQNVVNDMNIHRVAFGSFEMDSSWIAISKEGQIAWRNIPPRLHRMLRNREEDQAAPCEISLGSEGAYFVRFLDGEIDYCLPCFADEMASEILSRGAEITNIILNANVPDAFIIRHTELPE